MPFSVAKDAHRQSGVSVLVRAHQAPTLRPGRSASIAPASTAGRIVSRNVRWYHTGNRPQMDMCAGTNIASTTPPTIHGGQRPAGATQRVTAPAATEVATAI